MKGIISYNDYGFYSIPLSSSNSVISRKILNHGINEKDTINYISNNYDSGDIVHAGAYFGDFLPFLSSILTDDSFVWAFEPNKDSFESAEETIKLNDINNVLLYNMVLGKEPGKLFLKTSNKDKNLGGVSKVVNNKSRYTETVEIGVIDNIIPFDRKISIIHLDIEGYEVEALKGCINIIKISKPILILEELKKENLTDNKWFINNILDCGYKQTGKMERNLIFEFDKRI